MKRNRATREPFVAEHDNIEFLRTFSGTPADTSEDQISLTIRPQVIARLAAHREPDGAAGTGILLGRVQAEDRRSVIIEEIQLLAWRPTSEFDQGTNKTERLISSAVTKETNIPTIGLYAISGPMESEHLEQDLALFSRCFSHSGSIFVQFQTLHDSIVAHVYSRGTARVPVHAIDVSLPLESEQPRLTQPVPVPERMAPSSPPVALPKLVRARKQVLWVLGALAILVCGVGLYESRSAPPSRIGLHVERLGRDVQVTWDGNSSVFPGAKTVSLTIKDGGNTKDITLLPAELRQGHLLYIPASKDLDIHMRVFGPGAPVEESTRIIDGSASAPVMAANTDSPVAALLTQAIDTVLPSRQTFSKPAQPQPVPQTVVQKATRQFVPPAATPKPTLPSAAAGSELAPPEVTMQASQQTQAVQLPRPDTTRVQPPPAAPVPTPNPAQTALDSPPVKAAVPAQVAVSPPAPKRQFPLIVPDHLRRLISKQLSIDVQCTVNEAGQVTAVKTPRSNASLEGQLSFLAADTARKWVFTPARLHGQAVSSDYVITFTFHPPGR